MENKPYNLQNLIHEMVIAALNAFDTKKCAAIELGITERTLYNLIKRWDIKQVVDSNIGLTYKSHIKKHFIKALK